MNSSEDFQDIDESYEAMSEGSDVSSDSLMPEWA